VDFKECIEGSAESALKFGGICFLKQTTEQLHLHVMLLRYQIAQAFHAAWNIKTGFLNKFVQYLP